MDHGRARAPIAALILVFLAGVVAGGFLTVGAASRAFQHAVWARISSESKPAIDKDRMLDLADRIAARRFKLDAAQRRELRATLEELARGFPEVREDSAARLRDLARGAYERMAPSLSEKQRAEAEKVFR